jgi:hypothetical protein
VQVVRCASLQDQSSFTSCPCMHYGVFSVTPGPGFSGMAQLVTSLCEQLMHSFYMMQTEPTHPTSVQQGAHCCIKPDRYCGGT